MGMMIGRQHRNGEPHPEDEWCLPMLCLPEGSLGAVTIDIERRINELADGPDKRRILAEWEDSQRRMDERAAAILGRFVVGP